MSTSDKTVNTVVSCTSDREIVCMGGKTFKYLPNSIGCDSEDATWPSNSDSDLNPSEWI